MHPALEIPRNQIACFACAANRGGRPSRDFNPIENIWNACCPRKIHADKVAVYSIGFGIGARKQDAIAAISRYQVASPWLGAADAVILAPDANAVSCVAQVQRSERN